MSSLIKENTNIKKLNKQKVIHSYIKILQNGNSKPDSSYLILQEKLKLYFNLKTTLSELKDYFEPTITEESLDKKLTVKNAGVDYA